MLKKITEQDIESSGVVSVPGNRLEGDPEANKAVFDRLVKEVVAQVVNAVIDAHNELCADVGTLAEQLSSHVDANVNDLSAANISILRALADRYGLTDKMAPTVHDALEVLGAVAEAKEDLLKTKPLLDLEQYMDYWWVRRVSATTYEPVVGERVSPPGTYMESYPQLDFVAASGSAKGPWTIKYSKGVKVGIDGKLYFADQQEVTITSDTDFVTECDFLKGKYVKTDAGGIVCVPEDAVLKSAGHGNYALRRWADPICHVTLPDLSGREWERIHDSDRDAYPDEGELDGMEYRYMGVPVERLIDMMVEEATTE